MRSIRAALLVLALSACHPGKGEAPEITLAPALATVELTRFATVAGGRVLGALPVEVDAVGLEEGAGVTVKVEGATLLGADGEPLTGPLRTFPTTVYVEAMTPGELTLTATAEGAPDATATVTALPLSPLTGRSRDEAPGFGYADVFALGEAVEIAPDPALYPSLPEADVVVVPHRTLEGWVLDPGLPDVSGGEETLSFAAADLTTAGQVIWPSAEGVDHEGALGGAYDVVLDFDRDGHLSPGDRLWQGRAGNGVRVLADFGAAGPHPVVTVEANGGDWLGERVYYPEDISGVTPLVVISHGNGHDYTWYDYLGEHLASWGFVAMAHQNQTGPGIETASTTTLTNTDWLLTHLDSIADGRLTNLLDADHIGWIGHSRGGEGIVRAYTRLVEEETVPEAFGPASIRVLASIAPTVFNEVNISNPYGVRFHLLAGTADGDVTGGPENPVTQSFRLLQASTGHTSSTVIWGASHEDFDCCGKPEGVGPDQLEAADVQHLAKAYLLAIMAEGLRDDPYARAVLAADPSHLPATAFTATVQATWHPSDTRVIDDYQTDTDPAWASSGAAIDLTVADLREGALDDANMDLAWTESDPMNGMTQAEGLYDDAQGLVFSFEEPSWYGFELPSPLRDWSTSSWLLLSVCQGTRHPLTVALDGPLTFQVTVTDGAGVSVTRSTAPAALVAEPYQRAHLGDGKGWSNVFSTIRLPISEFTAGGTGLALTDIRRLTLEFGSEGDSPMGRVGLDDVELEP